MEMLKKCLNPKVLIGLAAVAIIVLLTAPRAFLATLPLLIIAACPLSMILMMGKMSKGHGSKADGQDNLATLKQRYAKGELSDEQYERMKRKLVS